MCEWRCVFPMMDWWPDRDNRRTLGQAPAPRFHDSNQVQAENGQKEIKQFQSCGLVLQRLLYRLISLDACLLAFLSSSYSIEVQIPSLPRSLKASKYWFQFWFRGIRIVSMGILIKSCLLWRMGLARKKEQALLYLTRLCWDHYGVQGRNRCDSRREMYS